MLLIGEFSQRVGQPVSVFFCFVPQVQFPRVSIFVVLIFCINILQSAPIICSLKMVFVKNGELQQFLRSCPGFCCWFGHWFDVGFFIAACVVSVFPWRGTLLWHWQPWRPAHGTGVGDKYLPGVTRAVPLYALCCSPTLCTVL